MKRIYWRKNGEGRYLFYIERKNCAIFCVTICISREIATWKRGRLKKLLMNPPPNSTIGVGRDWIYLTNQKYIEVREDEMAEVINKYNINICMNS